MDVLGWTVNTPAVFTGQVVLNTTTEGVALPGTTIVARFTDPNTSDAASSFTASINWGDGTTTSGTVAGSNGFFTVAGGHTYADEGSFPLGVTITDTANNANVSLSGTVAAAEADVLTAHPLTFTVSAGQSFSGTVATFADSDASNVASDFSATIDWGDGTTSAGVITDTAGAISVSGTHTYASLGQDAVSVTLSDDASGTATATANSTANVVALAGQIRLTAATEGVALPSTTTVATFTDINTSDTSSSFTATIDWGDGTTTSGTVAGSNGAFTVTGGHTYADEGSFPLGVTITDTANNTTLPLSGAVAAAEADVLTAQGLIFTANPGQAFSGTVATFTDSDTSSVASDFSATIDWGDGTTSAGVITDTAGAISVSGTHAYATTGQNAVSVTLSDDAPGTATGTANSTANVSGLTGQVVLNAATEGVALSSTTKVATFTDTNRSDTASSFTGIINWGDGTTTSGRVTGSNGTFTVTGGHSYAEEGSFPLGVTITDKANNTSLPLSGTVAAAEGDVLSAKGLAFKANAGQAFSGRVATFADRDKSTVASDFSAMIDWGDGTTTSAGVVSGGSGTFTLSGNHIFSAAGTDTVTVTLSEDAPGTATATAKSTANVRGPGGKTHSLALLNGDSSHTSQSAAELLASGVAFHGIDLSGLSLGATSTLADLSAGTNAAAGSATKDDPHGQTIAVLGHYMASSFVLPSDGHSGTTITEPQDQQHHLSLPHAR
jgi:hypothetical protein